METVPLSPAIPPSLPTADDGRPRTFVDDPDADLILRSCDLQEFRVMKLYLIKCSPVLDKRIRAISDHTQPAISTLTQSQHPVLQLPDDGAILSSLLTFILPVPPLLPPTLEETMELLSVAQKYEMISALSHIRNCVSSKDPPLICLDNAFHAYTLAQKYGLRQEAAQAAKITLKFNLTIENLAETLDFMPGAYLYELWKYHQSVRSNLLSNVEDFIKSAAHSSLSSIKCLNPSHRGIPNWLDKYISSTVLVPYSFDLFELQAALMRHVKEMAEKTISCGWIYECTSCSCISSETIRAFWTALTRFIKDNIAKAESGLSILGSWSGWETCPEDHTRPPMVVPPLPEYLYTCEADIIIQSSDLVHFRVHKSILATSSQFFRTMFSLPQPPTEMVTELPVLPMSEDAEIVRALLTVLYPIPSEIPVAYDRVLSLLVACQKYDMPAVQCFIRTEVRHRVPTTRTVGEVFRAYAIASRYRLSPETSTTACLTLNYPFTFESLGSELRLFEGWALRDLVRYRKLRGNDVVSCLELFLDIRVGPSKIWVGCPERSTLSSRVGASRPALPSWLKGLFALQILPLRENFMNPIIEPSKIRGKYLAALQAHAAGNETQEGCEFCLRVHARQGEEYCSELERKLAQARDKVFVTEADTPVTPQSIQ